LRHGRGRALPIFLLRPNLNNFHNKKFFQKILIFFPKTLDKHSLLWYNKGTKNERTVQTMERLKLGIYATAMNMRIMNAYEEIEDEDLAESMLTTWLMVGVPDGNELTDNINDFGDREDFDELFESYRELCRRCEINPNFTNEVAEIFKNIQEMLDNPYYNLI
jgi:hypothetical protein